MEFFSFDALERRFAVTLDVDLQLERLSLDGVVMSVKPWGEANSIHNFDDAQLGQSTLSFKLDPENQQISYDLHASSYPVITGIADVSEQAKSLLVQQPGASPHQSGKVNSFVLLGIAAKLFKSFKVIKVALLGASVAVYSVMFTVEFALALVAVLMFHEYGHVRAMKKFGIPTKGFYLIPFLGGVAVGDKARTQWESLYISMMGPVYGLVMTAGFYVAFLVTGSHFCGLVTSISALLNLVNLFPVYPLDGGHVVKALVFSRRNRIALVLLLSLSALCLYFSWSFGFYFLSFFIFIGVVDLITAWSVPISADITPLKTYGIWFSLAWYLAVALAFILLIVLLVEANVPGAEIATKILAA
ncbi:MAG: site-2 protease family protein [Gammaproteobacteria bacterium]|nr:MAG: site-2 protease family protein [Gammaproteobacteria bacterium]